MASNLLVLQLSFSCITLSALFIGVFSNDGHGTVSLSYDADSFKANLEEKRNFVMFFAPWCGHCKNLAPTWDELAKVYNKEADGPVTIAKVDCTEHTALCSEHDVTGFPTLKLFEKGGNSFKRYSGRRDLDSLKNFVQETILGTKDKAEASPGSAPEAQNLIVLDDTSFESAVASGAFFIKFYAPWCGHCKKLAPTWDELADTFAANDKVSIAKVDCTQNSAVCNKYEVRGYPTMLWFQDGEKIEKYQSSRTHDALRNYVFQQLEKAEKAGDAKEDGEEDELEEIEKVVDAVEALKGQVVDLNVDNFKTFLADRLVFVKFFAPWCGHCKRLAPVWEELAKELGDDAASVAKVDCTQHKSVCDEHQVRGYPTLKIFRNGEFLKDYRGARAVDDLADFVRENIAKRDEL